MSRWMSRRTLRNALLIGAPVALLCARGLPIAPAAVTQSARPLTQPYHPDARMAEGALGPSDDAQPSPPGLMSAARNLAEAAAILGIRRDHFAAWRDFTDVLQVVLPTPPSAGGPRELFPLAP